MNVKGPVSSTVLWRNREKCLQLAQSYKKWLHKVNFCTALVSILTLAIEVCVFYLLFIGTIHSFNNNRLFLVCLSILGCLLSLYFCKWIITVLIPTVRQIQIDFNEQAVYYDTYLKIESFVDFILSHPKFDVINFISNSGECCEECTVTGVFADVDMDEITFFCDTENGEQELSLPISNFFEEN